MLNQAIKEENKPNKNNEEVTNEDMVALRDEIEELKKENNKLKQHLINIEKNLGQPGNEYLTNINGDNNYETYDKIVNKRCSNIIYKNPEIIIGNPVQTKDNVTKVVIVDTEDKKMEKSIQWTYRKRFPELLEVTGKFEVLEQKTTIRSHKDKGANVRKLIKIEYDGTEKDLYDRIEDIREETRGDEWIAMHTINKISTERLGKMIELIFTGIETNVVIYTNKDETNSTASNKEKKSYALVVEQAGTGYNEVLKTVKNCVRGTEASKKINSIRSTREGKLLIITDKDQKTLNELKETINQKIINAKVKTIGETQKRKTVYIRGIDALTRKEEIRKAIGEKIEKIEEIYISETRPTVNNTQTVTVSGPLGSIDKIKGRIRIGFTRCNIETKIDINRCYRCWGYEHNARHCVGPDRSGLCYKCGKGEHSSKECKSVEFCVTCEVTGHSTGGMRCKVFRRMISRSRREINKPVNKEIVNEQTQNETNEDKKRQERGENDRTIGDTKSDKLDNKK
ncbi:uncharacterized protein [Euwallacea fornicatus]|uniref:uncharacterized protein n=1 Tax=Euwallacea fornicatus TaxID=995702 RepID=UPI0033906B5F